MMDELGPSPGTFLDWGMGLLSTVYRAAGSPFKGVGAWCNGAATTLASGAKIAAKKMVICIVLLVVVLWVAVLLYASFYHMYVPTATLMRPAHFKFRVCPSGVGMCSFPMANVTLGAENRAEVLGRGQQYRVVLDMRVPDSTPNRDVGMFMVIIRMYDRYGVITQESSRAVSLKYQSDLLKIVQTVAFAPLYLTGFAEEIQTLNIDLFGNFWDDYYRPSVGALLEIHSRQLVFYTAQLQFHASYGGLRYYLFYYPVTCAFLGILFNCLWLTPALLILCYSFGLGLLNGASLFNDQAIGEGKREPRGGGDKGGDDIRQGRSDGDEVPCAQLELEEKEVETVPSL